MFGSRWAISRAIGRTNRALCDYKVNIRGHHGPLHPSPFRGGFLAGRDKRGALVDSERELCAIRNYAGQSKDEGVAHLYL